VAFVGSSIGNTNITLNATAPVTITGGTGAVGAAGFGAIAGIGAVGGFNADVTINGQAGITLNKGGGPGFADAFIGSDTGGGTITLKAGLGGAGSLLLNDGRASTTGNVTLQAANAISQSTAGIVVANLLTTASGAATTLAGSANQITSLSSTTTDSTLTVSNNSALDIAGIDTGTGAITLVNAGAITQSAPMVAGGPSSLNAGANAITLNNALNDFTGVVSLAGGATQIADANALALGTLATGALTATSTGALNLGQGTVAGNLVAITSGGPILQSSGLTVTGTSNLNAGANAITLTDSGNSFAGALTLAGSPIYINSASPFTLGPMNTSSLTVSAPSISQSAPLTVSGTATFNSSAGPSRLPRQMTSAPSC
jgi:hypothetical protein